MVQMPNDVGGLVRVWGGGLVPVLVPVVVVMAVVVFVPLVGDLEAGVRLGRLVPTGVTG